MSESIERGREIKREEMRKACEEYAELKSSHYTNSNIGPAAKEQGADDNIEQNKLHLVQVKN